MVSGNAHTIDPAPFRRALIAWGCDNYRVFPWRQTHDAYRLLIAEIMLHRTQAIQVVPVYLRFVARYPDLATLATADRGTMNDLLYSLGLRWRIDLIYDMVVNLMSRFHGLVPRDKAELLSLPGVSNYIASAVRCFAWDIPDSLIDTNTVRVIGRVFGLDIRESSRRNTLFRTLISALVDPGHPRAYNYALLDLADQICTKKRPPLCTECPVVSYCVYGSRRLAGDVTNGGDRRNPGG